MTITAFLSFVFTAAMMILSILFKVAGKLRLTVPFIYFLLTATFLNKWAATHETMAFIILFALIGLSLVSWLVTFLSRWSEKRSIML